MKRKRRLSLLALVLAVIVFAATGCTGYSEETSDGPWEAKLSPDDEKAFVYQYTWDGTEEGLRIVPPAEIGGCKVVQIGGYYGKGAPCPFHVELKDMFSRQSAPEEEKRKDLVFTLVIGPKISDVFYNDTNLGLWYYGKDTTGENRVYYRVLVQVELDPANPYFYMKDGWLYKKDTDEYYPNFYNPSKQKTDSAGQ